MPEWLFWTLVIIWIITAIESYGRSFAYMQRRYAPIAEENYWSDMRNSFVMALFGPINTAATFVSGIYGHGYKFR